MSSERFQLSPDLRDLLVREAPTVESARQLTPAVVEAVKPTGAFRMYVPSIYNGPATDPVTAIDLVASLAEADAATAWCAAIASLSAHVAGVLEPEAAMEVFGDPSSIACGAFAPTAKGLRVDRGYRVTGRWAWGSGSPVAQWMSGGVMTDDNRFLQMIFPMTDITLHDTWHSNGLRGTGSHDFSVDDVFVPSNRAVQLGVSKPKCTEPISLMPLFPLFGAGVAAVMIGIARRAISELTDLATVKKPAQSSKTLAQSQVAQIEIARAEGIVRSCYAYLVDEMSLAWETIVRGDRLGMEQRMRCRLAASHAGPELCRAVDIAYNLGGGSSVFTSSPLERCFRDIHTASAHIIVGSRALESIGRQRFGLESDLSSF